jgi:hypothetical protein
MKEIKFDACDECEGKVCIDQKYTGGRIQFSPKDLRTTIMSRPIKDCPFKKPVPEDKPNEVEDAFDKTNLGS